MVVVADVAFLFKISLLKKKSFLFFFSAFEFNLNKHCKLFDAWIHVDRKFISSLLNKFYKWSLIFLGLKFLSA